MSDANSLSFEPDHNVRISTEHGSSVQIGCAATAKFGTKAETLAFLQGRIHSATVLDQVSFEVSEWKDSENVFAKLQAKNWLEIPLIVRSSARCEDSESSSMAGCYDSVLNVLGAEEFSQAVIKVIESYGQPVPGDQVLVQPMLQDVALGGVAFSIDPNTGSPYRVISYSERSTTGITSGQSGKTFYSLRGSDASHLPSAVQAVLVVLAELETVMNSDLLDIEFGINSQGDVFLLQCRPLVVALETPAVEQVQERLQRIENKIDSLNKAHPYLMGSRTIFAVMPDWNPAEIIGIRPKPLALSMYKELITDAIWAYQRSNYGYRNLRSFPLIVNFCGLPYVDVRADFNSFVPADISPELGNRLVNYYVDRLIENPANHDKIEFEIVSTCYTFDLKERMDKLLRFGFSEEDCTTLTESLCNLTNRIIHEADGLWKTDIGKINKLEARIDAIQSSDLDTVSKIFWLIEDCKRYGTLPFAGLARAGFIAVQMMKSLVTIGVFSSQEYDSFMASLDSVSSRMSRDFHRLSRAAFLKEYGHLRPGTYDILSPRYDEEPDRYFDWSTQSNAIESEAKDFHLSLGQLKAVEKLLREHNVQHDVLGFFDFIRAAIEGREVSKFVFTRSLSDALSLFKNLAAEHGFSAEDCSFARIDCIKQLYSSSHSIRSVLETTINEGKREYFEAGQLRLPSVIVDKRDVRCFEVLPSEPNFITQKSTVGSVAFSTGQAKDLRDSILFIPSADPGFDWVFSHGVKGFVTMYGGVNSHMAIRAGELGIPAVIGAGELLYEQWSSSAVIQLDCANRQVVRIK